jgi:hypothetical protein
MNVFLIDLLKLPNSLFKQSIKLPLFCASHFALIAACLYMRGQHQVYKDICYRFGHSIRYTHVVLRTVKVVLTSSALVRVLTKSIIAASSVDIEERAVVWK